MSDEVGASIRDLVFSLPVVDTHTHIRQWKEFEQPVTAYKLLNSSGTFRAMCAVSGALSRQEFRGYKSLDDWASLGPAMERVRNTAFCRIILRGLKELYELEFDEFDESVMRKLGERISEAYRNPECYRTVLKEKAGFEAICRDSRGEFDRDLFTPVVRMDNYVLFGLPGWGDDIVRKHGEERTATLDGLVSCLEEDFRAAVEDGSAAIKSNLCWGRTLSFECVSEAVANDALAVCRSAECDDEREKLFGDYMMAQVARLCAEQDIPLQIHTGPAGGIDHIVEYGNPLNLNNLIVRNPETTFVLFHAGGPFVGESAALATQFPNVYLDLCGVMGRDSLKRILDDWIELVPRDKIMWGTDVHTVEESYSVVRNFREILSELLSERLNSGYLSLGAAEEFAEAILAGNAGRVLRVLKVSR